MTWYGPTRAPGASDMGNNNYSGRMRRARATRASLRLFERGLSRAMRKMENLPACAMGCGRTGKTPGTARARSRSATTPSPGSKANKFGASIHANSSICAQPSLRRAAAARDRESDRPYCSSTTITVEGTLNEPILVACRKVTRCGVKLNASRGRGFDHPSAACLEDVQPDPFQADPDRFTQDEMHRHSSLRERHR